MTLFADFEALKVGDSEQLTRTITAGDVRRFVEMTGDDNPLHVDPAFAESTPFKEVVVHGMLGASFLSTLIGTKLPGPGALWVSQNMEFQNPVRVGDVLTVSCTVLKKHERDRLLDLDTRIVNQRGQGILSGKGQVKMVAGPGKPAAKKDPMLAPREKPAAKKKSTERRLAIISGGAGGIGRAIAVRLAKDGFDVVVNYRENHERARQVAAEIQKAGGKAVTVAADISTANGAKRVIAAAEELGGADVLVNNASPRINGKAFSDMNWDDILEHLHVQVKGAFLLSQGCLPHMIAQGNGRIVSISSAAIDGTPSPTWTSYAMAKASLATMSRYLAAEVGPSGVTVNCVSPGMTETRLIGDISEKVQLMVARQTPLRRLAQPEDIAGAVAWLVSPDAAFVTGQVLRVNGGIAMS